MEKLASIALKVPLAMAFDNILPYFQGGSPRPVNGIKRFLGSKKIELLDRQVLDNIDIVVLCTGYQADFSIIEPDGVATSVLDAYDYAKAARVTTPLYRLWMNIFPPARNDDDWFIIDQPRPSYSQQTT